MNDLEMSLAYLSQNKDSFDKIAKHLSFPNIPFPTMGGEIWWNELASYNGWRLQENMVTHHSRIIDENNIRRAWGTTDAMIDFLTKVKSLNEAFK